MTNPLEQVLEALESCEAGYLADESVSGHGFGPAHEIHKCRAAITTLRAHIEAEKGWQEQHARDSAELRRLCQARDDASKQRDLIKKSVVCACDEAISGATEMPKQSLWDDGYFTGIKTCVTVVHAAIDTAKALEAEQGWRPIESVPKDFGFTHFDVWARGERVANCWWGFATYDDAAPRRYGVVHQSDYDCNGPVDSLVVKPTHWMPLPQPPAIQAGTSERGEG